MSLYIVSLSYLCKSSAPKQCSVKSSLNLPRDETMKPWSSAVLTPCSAPRNKHFIHFDHRLYGKKKIKTNIKS